MPSNEIITRFTQNPKRLFLIDGIGALLSAFLLGIVLVALEPFVGIPKSTLYILAVFPIGFALVDAFGFWFTSQVALVLKVIATLNLLYIALSLALASYHLETITLWGWIYITGELAIVLALAITELKVARRLQEKSVE